MADILTHQEMQEKIKAGQAKLLCLVGVQQRPVYEVDGEVYEKAIHFDDGLSHNHFYKASPERAKGFYQS